MQSFAGVSTYVTLVATVFLVLSVICGQPTSALMPQLNCYTCNVASTTESDCNDPFDKRKHQTKPCGVWADPVCLKSKVRDTVIRTCVESSGSTGCQFVNGEEVCTCGTDGCNGADRSANVSSVFGLLAVGLMASLAGLVARIA